ncbi:MAG: hypothetical protein P4L46_12730 [Fimbriimonas sp.]|nr:hypothetical protein [Fimbriimonas sp.]
MKNSLPTGVVVAIVAVVAIVIGFFLIRIGTSGPQTQGVESMPPAVKKAFMSAGQNPALQKKPSTTQ